MMRERKLSGSCCDRNDLISQIRKYLIISRYYLLDIVQNNDGNFGVRGKVFKILG